MDKQIKPYRQIIIDLLQNYMHLPAINVGGDDVEEQLIVDEQRDHYQVLAIGWENGKRVCYPVFHLDIRDGKIWVQEDATDSRIVDQLEKAGVPKKDIVLAFMAPYKRSFTDYAVA